MKVLVIAYYFPPYGGGPTVRVHNFVRHFPEFGIHPVVLTVDERYYEAGYHDPSLLGGYDESIKVYRTGMFFGEDIQRMKSALMKNSAAVNTRAEVGNQPSVGSRWKRGLKHLLVPDEQIFWAAKGIRCGLEVIETESPDLILATAPPFSSHLLGTILSRKSSLPLVVDYRDLWTDCAFYARDPLARDLELNVLRHASRVLITNEAAEEKLTRSFPVVAGKTSVIENGFELEEIRRIQVDGSPGFPLNGRSAITFSHIGSLTARRTPEYFFAALNKVRNLIERPLRVNFIGFVPPQYKALAQRMGLADCVQFGGAVSRSEALDVMCNRSHALLLFQRLSEGGDTAIPGKLYEYLAAAKPLLVMDEGKSATSRFLARVGAEDSIGYQDVDAIAARIERICRSYEASLLNASMLSQRMSGFDRRLQTGRVADLLMQTALQPPPLS
jgi:glycosyltransferase involved in cell wall biosynthesis